jgi:DNA-binding NarL/FixJ family response regulator
MTTVLIVDDLISIREFLKVNLSSEPDIQVVGLAENGDMAIAKAEEHQPDIILMDINMPGEIDGIQATERITQRFPQIKVLLLTTQDDKEQLDRSLKAGSRGYILKNTSIKDITNVIRLAEKGFFQIGPMVGNWDGTQHNNLHSNANNYNSNHTREELGLTTLIQPYNSGQPSDISNVNHTLPKLSSEVFQLQKTMESQETTIINLTNQYSEVQQEIKTKLNSDRIPYSGSGVVNYGFKTSRPRSRQRQNVLFICSFLLGIITVLFLVLLTVVLGGLK